MAPLCLRQISLKSGGLQHRVFRCAVPCNRSRKNLTTRAVFQSHSRTTDTGTLHPGELWYPKWMQYRQRPDNYTFWTQKFLSNSLQIPEAKLDVYLANRSNGEEHTVSLKMALRRLHFKNTLLGEVLYYVNLLKTGRIHLLPPARQPTKRPTFFFVF